MSDERLDRLIDEVARQMTAGQVSGDFRARVIASLDRGPRRLWRPMWIFAPLGTLAVAILVIVVARPFHPSTCSGCPERVEGQGRNRGAESPALRESRQTPLRAPGSSRPDGANSAVRPNPETVTVLLKPDTTYEARGRRTYRPSGAAAAVDALAPPRLELAPIGVQPLGVDALPTESIAVPQLDAIAPIVVDPLRADDARRPSGDQRPSPNDRDQ